jgi:catechol 2,3-dioxygenase
MTELPAGTSLGAIRLRVGDIDRMRTFYEDAIGLRTLDATDGLTALGVEGVTPFLELQAAPEAPPRPRGSTGLFHLAVLVPTRADLARALRRLVGAGTRLEGASDHLVSEALYLSDPEGNGIELYRDRPREQWPRTGESIQMATIPLDLDDLLTENGADAAAMPAGTTLGHVHLQVSDLESAEPFWVDALGFEVMARMPPHAAFVAVGGYHHHVGLNTWAGIGAPPPPAGARGLARFEVVLPSEAELDAAAERLARVSEVERTGDGALAHDPSGNAVLLRT